MIFIVVVDVDIVVVSIVNIDSVDPIVYYSSHSSSHYSIVTPVVVVTVNADAVIALLQHYLYLYRHYHCHC